MIELYNNDNHLGHIKVLEQGDVRYLEVNGGCQGAYHVKNKYPLSRYIYAMCDMFTVHDRRVGTPSEILMIGAGAMLLPNLLAGRHNLTIIDSDPRIFQVSRFFDYDFKNASILAMTGESWLRGHKPKMYDYIFVDAYLGYKPDQFLYSAEGLEHQRAALKDDGALITNLLDGPELKEAQEYNLDALDLFTEARQDFLKPGIKGLRNVISIYHGKI